MSRAASPSRASPSSTQAGGAATSPSVGPPLSAREEYLKFSGAAGLIEHAILALSAARPDNAQHFLAQWFNAGAPQVPEGGARDSALRCIELTAEEEARERRARAGRRRARVYVVAAAAHEPGAPGFVAGRVHGSPLSSDGEAQAAALAARLRREGVRFDAALSSPHERARRTAQLLLEPLGFPVESLRLSDDLKERCLGSLVGKPLRDLATPERLDEVYRHGVFWRPPGTSLQDGAQGESDWDVERRAFLAVEELLRPDDASAAGADRLDERERVCLVVTHPTVVRCVARGVLSAGAVFRHRCGEPPPCSITELQYDSSGTLPHQGWKLLRLADAAHNHAAELDSPNRRGRSPDRLGGGSPKGPRASGVLGRSFGGRRSMRSARGSNADPFGASQCL